MDIGCESMAKKNKETFIEDIHTLFEYMRKDEKKHFEECEESDESHIFLTLKRIRDHLGLGGYYVDDGSYWDL